MEDVTSSFGEEIIVDLGPLLDEFDGEIESVSVSGLPDGATFDQQKRVIRGVITKDDLLSYIVSVEIELQAGGAVGETFVWSIRDDENLNYIPDQHSLINQSVVIPLSDVLASNAYVKVGGLPNGITYHKGTKELKGTVLNKVEAPIKVSVIYADKSAEIFSFNWHIFDTEKELEDYIHSEKEPLNSTLSDDVELTTELVEILDNVATVKEKGQPVANKEISKKLLPFGFLILALAILLFPVKNEVYLPGTLVPFQYTYIEAPYDGVLETYSLESGDTVDKGSSVISYRVSDLKEELDRELLDLRILKGEYQRLLDQPDKAKSWELLQALSLSELSRKELRVSELYAMLENPVIVSSKSGLFFLNESIKKQGDFVRKGEYVGIVSEVLEHIQVNVSSDHLNLLKQSNNFKFYSLPDEKPFYLELVDISENPDKSTTANFPYQITARVLDVSSDERLGKIGKVEIAQGYAPFLASLL